MDDAGILLSQRTGGGRAAALGAARQQQEAGRRNRGVEFAHDSPLEGHGFELSVPVSGETLERPVIGSPAIIFRENSWPSTIAARNTAEARTRCGFAQVPAPSFAADLWEEIRTGPRKAHHPADWYGEDRIAGGTLGTFCMPKQRSLLMSRGAGLQGAPQAWGGAGRRSGGIKPSRRGSTLRAWSSHEGSDTWRHRRTSRRCHRAGC